MSGMSNLEFNKVFQSSKEQERIDGLLQLIPKGLSTALDAGARTGYISEKLATHFDSVTALDLELPQIAHPKIKSVQGDITNLVFPDKQFDLVFCAEVLEHIPTHMLEKACLELSRAARQYVLIGVPYKQDIRVGRTTCPQCGKTNPPWGHVNIFDEQRLVKLFPSLRLEKLEFIGETRGKTNILSAWLNEMAGHPWGTYDQQETCLYCSAKITPSVNLSFSLRIIAKLAHVINQVQLLFVKPQPNWIHVLFVKD